MPDANIPIGRDYRHVAMMKAGSLPAHGRLPLNRPGKPRQDSGRPSRQNEREADRPAGALYAVPLLYLMFWRKKTEPVKPKPKLDKSGIWYDSIMFHHEDTSNRGEARILTEYQKRHPDATPAFATNVIFGNYIYWSGETAPGNHILMKSAKAFITIFCKAFSSVLATCRHMPQSPSHSLDMKSS